MTRLALFPCFPPSFASSPPVLLFPSPLLAPPGRPYSHPSPPPCILFHPTKSKARSGGGRGSRGASTTRYTKLTHPALGVLLAGDSVRLQAAPTDPPGTEMLARIEYFTRIPASGGGPRDKGGGGGGGSNSAFLGLWYYRPTDVEAAGGGGKIPTGTHPRELFLSDHSDVNPTSSIIERIDVWSARHYEALLRGVDRAAPSLPVPVLVAGYVCRLHYGASDHSFRLLSAVKAEALEASARRHGHAPGAAEPGD